MVTCVNDAMFPDTGKAVVRLLRRLGVEVDFPAAQTCCAQPMVNTGYLDEAVPVVRTYVDAFAGYDAATKDWLRNHAAALEALHEAGRDADMVGYVHKEKFDMETKLALWTLLPSKLRSAYKKADMATRTLAEQG